MIKNPKKISHSSVDKYLLCPRLWKYHYKDRIRPIGTTSALLFGSCLDEALNEILENFKKDNALDLAKDVFDKTMRNWLDNDYVSFFKKDFDKRILSEEDKKYIDNIEEVKQTHTFGWLCLYNRGITFLNQYMEQVVPLIDEVISVQKSIEKTNQYGDSIIMHLDAVIKWKACDHNPGSSFISTTDHKTSSASYSQRKTDESTQLALYSKFEETKHQTYVVFRKDLDNKGNIRPIQIKHSKVSDEVIDRVLCNFDNVLEQIKNDNFPKTDKKYNCTRQFGKQCVYIDICQNGKQLSECDDLIKK